MAKTTTKSTKAKTRRRVTKSKAPSRSARSAPNLVIVESPAKAKTIEQYLGPGYLVLASFGHVRDLPKSRLGIDVDNGFTPDYIIPRGLGKRVKELITAANAATTIYLATDLDREGEAIAWHLSQAIEPKQGQKWQRITFSEITKDAIQQAVAHPREINTDLVDAQQARRVLDRLVGYTLSPILWKKVRYGLSAGRVQSVALKFIVDREREIEAFKAEKYWTIEAEVESEKQPFKALLDKIDGKKVELKEGKVSDKIVEEIKANKLSIRDINSRESKRNPTPPFTTSTLQQAASGRLSYGTRRTMIIAQNLYEAGLISYMRTDSTNLSTQALTQAHDFIQKEYGKEYGLEKPRIFTRKQAQAQEAHEAIRPTDFSRRPEDIRSLAPEQQKLYRLIWQRALASQMAQARLRHNSIDIAAGAKGEYNLRATGQEVIFDGFQKVYGEAPKSSEVSAKSAPTSQILPKLTPKSALQLNKLESLPHETQPPARYSEAALVKKLESEGIGRPSTYAPTISTIINRGYVLNEERALKPQPTGMIVSDLLSENFGFVVDPKFTARVENELDEVAEGKIKWEPVVAEFYNPMIKEVNERQDKIEKVKMPVIETEEVCEVCGKMMVIKSGRFGQFLACSGWPDCKNAKPLLKDTGVSCPKCEEGNVVERKTKKGRTFYGCSRYPKCDYATWTKPKTAEETVPEPAA